MQGGLIRMERRSGVYDLYQPGCRFLPELKGLEGLGR